jgi:hydroxymethylpyrimidine kinase/phosphomethylpyrimidine kinase
MYTVKVRKKALTVGGSDSSGGAGIQADLKAFTSLGIHGATVITCITAQNTKGVQGLFPLEPEQVAAQFDSVAMDLQPPVGKTGLLCTATILKVVTNKISEYGIKTVVDPVLTSTTGYKLTHPHFPEALREHLLPEAYLLTPNLDEASVLVGWKVHDLEGMKKAAVELKDLGAKNVLVKGGHLEGDWAIDVLLTDEIKLFKAKKQPLELHGTGCVLSAFITSFLALGKDLPSAVKQAKLLMTQNIRHGYDIGFGIEVVDTHAHLFNDAEKYRIVQDVRRSAAILEKVLIPELVPEVGVNIGYALPHPSDRYDVCALEGRIFHTGDRIIAAGTPEFGASARMADIILTASAHDHRIRSAVNILYNKKIIDACPVLTYKVGTFDRSDEPKGVKTMEWGINKAIEALGAVPDIIYDTGGHSKEPMIRVLGNNPHDVLAKLRTLIDEAFPQRTRPKKVRKLV